MRILIQLTCSLMGLLVLAHDAVSAITAQAVVATSNKTIYEKMPYCPPRYWNYSFIQYLPVDYNSFVANYPDVRNSSDPNVNSLPVQSGYTKIKHEMVYTYCSDFVQIGVVRRTLQNTSNPSDLKAVLNVFFLSTVLNTSTFTTSGFLWPTVQEDLNYEPSYSLNITAMTSEIAGAFFVLTRNKVSGATQLHMFGFPMNIALTLPFTPVILKTIILDAGKGDTSTRMSIGVKTKTVSLYDTDSNKIHLYSYNQFTKILVYNRTINYESGCTLQRLHYSYHNPFDWNETQINYDDYTTVCSNGPDFSIKIYRLVNNTNLDWNLRHTLANEAASTAVAPIRIENGFMVGYYVKKLTATGKPYHALKLIDVSEETAIRTLDEELVIPDFTGQEYENGASLYGYFAYHANPKQIHLFGIKYRSNYGDSDLNNRVLVSSRYYFGRTECFRSDCLMCLEDSAGPCFSCGYNYISWAGNCFLYTDPQPEGTYRIGSKYLDCKTENCADCKADINVCVRCKYSEFEKYYLHIDNKQCLSLSQIMELDAMGIKDSSKEVVPCSQTECDHCPLDYQKCQACDTSSSKPYLNPLNSLCIAEADIPAGYGKAATGSYELKLCAIGANCADCKLDFNVCKACVATYTLQEVLSRTPAIGCTLDTVLATILGYGLDTAATPAIFKSCKINACLKCIANYEECETCMVQRPYNGIITATGVEYCFDKDMLATTSTYGISSDTTFDACRDSNCYDCHADYAVCTVCKTSGNPMIILIPSGPPDPITGVQPTSPISIDMPFLLHSASTNPTKMCLKYSEIPDGYGVNNNELTPCSTDNCKKCNMDFAVCTECVTTYYPFNNAGTNVCIKPEDAPEGFGFDSSTPEISPCVVTNCGDCKSDWERCTSCKANHYLAKDYDTNVDKCWSTSEIEEGYGIIYPTMNLEKCADSNCKYCKQDYQNCTECNYDTSIGANGFVNFAYLLPVAHPVGVGYQPPNPAVVPGQDIPVFKCVYENDFPTGFGKPNPPDPNSKLQPCTDTDCSDCKENFAVCNECASPYYKDVSLLNNPQVVRCITAAEIIDGSGIVEGQFVVDKCQDLANCKKCAAKNSFCTLCKPTASYKYLDESEGTCHYSGYMAGEGKDDRDSNKYVLTPCSISDCTWCRDGYATCETCGNDKWLFRPGTTAGECVIEADIATKTYQSKYYGKSVGASIKFLAECPTYCTSCVDDSTKCTACEANYYRFLGGCKLNTDTSQTAGYGLDAKIGAVEYLKCDDTKCTSCQPYYKDCLACETGYTLAVKPNNDKFCVANGDYPDGYGKDLDLTPPQLRACADANCKRCSDDYKICTECNAQHYWLKSAVVGMPPTCIKKEEAPHGWGLDLQKSNHFDRCALATCSDCFDDNTVCKACFSPMHLVMDKSKCVEHDTIPTGQGSSGGPILTACKDTRCMDCRTSYAQCSVCNPGYRVNSSYECEPCTVTGCSKCDSQADKCSACYPDFAYYIASSSFKICVKDQAAIQVGYGIVAGTAEVRTCGAGTPNCKTCEKTDHLKCLTCNSPYYYMISSASCVSDANIPAGYGKDESTSGDWKAKKCAINRCQNCHSDWNTCSNCSNTAADKLYMEGSGGSATCKYSTELTAGTGPNLLTFAVKNCDIAQCDSCEYDASTCLSCSANYRLFMPSGGSLTCIQTTATPTDGFGFDTSDPDGIIRACESSRCLKCASNYKICTECREEFYLYPSDANPSTLRGTCETLGNIVAGYGVDLTQNKKLGVCSIGCLTCQTQNRAACLTCPANKYYRKVNPSDPNTEVECLGIWGNFPEIPGLGKDGANLALKACSEGALCKNCWNDITACTACFKVDPITGATMYFNGNSATRCIPYSSILDNFGVNVASENANTATSIKGCTLGASCLKCKANADICDQCAPSYYLKNPTSCITIGDMPQGFGVLTGSSPATIAKCDLETCKDCANDHTICKECIADHLRIMDGTNVVACFPKTQPLFEYQGEKYGLKGDAQNPLSKCPSNCFKCNDMECDACNTNYALTSTYTCVSDAEIGDGYGKTTVDGVVVVDKCSDENCKECLDDITVCNKCLVSDASSTDLFEFRQADNSQVCYTLANLPNGFGLDTETGKIRACSSSLCEVCQDDYSKCMECKADAWFYSPDTDTDHAICYKSDTESIDVSYGKDAASATKELVACDLANCKDCFDDYLACKVCATNYLLSMKDQECHLYTETIDGYGRDYTDPVVGKFSSCAIRDCKKCSESAITACTECDTDFYLESGTSTAIPKCHSSLPEGFGPVEIDSMSIAPCSADNCASCPQSISTCTSCLYELQLKDNKCTVPVVEEGLGYDSESKLYKKCKQDTENSCAECRRDYEICARCYAGFVLDESTGKCYKLGMWSTFPDGKGVNGFVLSTCSLENCNRCPTSKDTCEECKTGFTLNVFTTPTTCEKSTDGVDVEQLKKFSNSRFVEAEFDRSSQSSMLHFSSPLPKIDYKENLLFIPYKKDGTQIKGASIKRASLVVDNTQVYFEFESAEYHTDVTALLLSKSSAITTTPDVPNMGGTTTSINPLPSGIHGNSRLLAESSNPFDTGVVLKDLTLHPTSDLKTMKIVSIIVTIVLVLLTLASFKHGKYYGFKVLYYHTLLASLVYLSAQRADKFKGLLMHLDWTVASFVPLPRVNEDKLSCTPIATWYFANISCFVYDNLRKYVVPIALILILQNILMILSRGSSRTTGPKTFMERARAYIDGSFLFKLFAAISPLWMIAALSNIYYGAPSTIMGVGMFLATIILIMYVGWFFLNLVKIFQLRTDSVDALENKSANADLLKSSSKIALLAHNVDLFKTAVYACLIVFLQTHPIGQSVAAAITFGVSVLYLIALRPHSDLLDSIFVILIEVCFVGIFVVNSFLAHKNLGLDTDKLNKTYSTAFFVLFFAVIGLLFLWFIRLFFKPRKGATQAKTYEQIGELNKPIEFTEAPLVTYPGQPSPIALHSPRLEPLRTVNLPNIVDEPRVVHQPAVVQQPKMDDESRRPLNFYESQLQDVPLELNVNEAGPKIDVPVELGTAKIPNFLPKEKGDIESVKASLKEEQFRIQRSLLVDEHVRPLSNNQSQILQNELVNNNGEFEDGGIRNLPRGGNR